MKPQITFNNATNHSPSKPVIQLQKVQNSSGNHTNLLHPPIKTQPELRKR